MITCWFRRSGGAASREESVSFWPLPDGSASRSLLVTHVPSWAGAAETLSFLGPHLRRCERVAMLGMRTRHSDDVITAAVSPPEREEWEEWLCLLVRTVDAAAAEALQRELYGQPLSSFDPSRCGIVFVDDAEADPLLQSMPS